MRNGRIVFGVGHTAAPRQIHELAGHDWLTQATVDLQKTQIHSLSFATNYFIQF